MHRKICCGEISTAATSRCGDESVLVNSSCFRDARMTNVRAGARK